ncbi:MULTISPECIES: transcriptional regulator [unclassified Streptomyces]|uniref:transcriptional regulator n=1 Tax=unclassified Streptomyces TaxID=2593676 RepID=UPI001660FF5E|nr:MULTISPECIES: transcriptional regulator [unclassified Streptomyces]MBD0708836.1 transcriptional regulator [Streptomyces sp. CBMA291]MBD0717030.1 transcriptional regulator [Streptomyces sp. CBMA370]
MPENTHDFGHYGARGIKGSAAAARQLDRLVEGIASPVTSRRGLLARLHYLSKSPHALRQARAAGLTVTDRTLKAWLAGDRRPNRVNLDRIDRAYWAVRRLNVARYLLTRLNSRGGTRVELHPVNQSQVAQPHQRVLGFRSLNIRRWDGIVAAWVTGDERALDDAWVDQIADLGSDWGKYEYVTNLGFAA